MSKSPFLILIVVSGALFAEVPHPAHVEVNLPLLPYVQREQSLSDNWGVFGGVGFPIILGAGTLGPTFIINAGADYYPLAPAQGLYLQLECPLIIGQAVVYDGSDSSDGFYAGILPGWLVGGKFYPFNDSFYVRTGVGLGFPLTQEGRESLSHLETMYDYVQAGFRVQLSIGVSN